MCVMWHRCSAFGHIISVSPDIVPSQAVAWVGIGIDRPARVDLLKKHIELRIVFGDELSVALEQALHGETRA